MRRVVNSVCRTLAVQNKMKGEVVKNNDLSMSLSAVEMQEYLFSETLAKVAAKCEIEKHNVIDWTTLKNQIRESFRLQRFAVMNWLRMNGVSIPVELLSDQAHKPVGQQMPDMYIDHL